MSLQVKMPPGIQSGSLLYNVVDITTDSENLIATFQMVDRLLNGFHRIIAQVLSDSRMV